MEHLEYIRNSLAVYTVMTYFALIAAIVIWRFVPRRARFVAVAGISMAFTAGFPTVADKAPPARKSVFTIDPYLTDAGSYSTNDTVHVALVAAYAELALEGCPIMLYYKSKDNPTNALGEAVWTLHPDIWPFSSPFARDYVMTGATNYDYTVLVDYTPPTPVHTNGVFELRGFELSETEEERAAAFTSTSIKTQE